MQCVERSLIVGSKYEMPQSDYERGWNKAADYFAGLARYIPDPDVSIITEGYWITVTDPDGNKHNECSLCSGRSDEKTPFCPHCGKQIGADSITPEMIEWLKDWTANGYRDVADSTIIQQFMDKFGLEYNKAVIFEREYVVKPRHFIFTSAKKMREEGHAHEARIKYLSVKYSLSPQAAESYVEREEMDEYFDSLLPIGAKS